MRRTSSWSWTVAAALLLLGATEASRAETGAAGAEGVEFFEKKIRPILVEHCHACHSARAKKLRGGLLLDGRDGALKGGDTGPAIVPGHPEKSRLVRAITFEDPDLHMPPRGKLPPSAIADLTTWVRIGAPWPRGQGTAATRVEEKTFDLAQRRQEHWAWKPVVPVQPPRIEGDHGGGTPVDAFLLVRLKKAGLRPAAPADRAVLLRRLSFDLTGLPPTPAEVEAFLADSSPDAYQKVVDRLLASPRFGERWGRHWLDLVRYAETRGHEFDFPIPNAYQYRDYVIRAFNADVPYDQLVTEHLAGDLLKSPRLHPAEGFNESLLATGFWYLGEEVHSPVDIRLDQADRIDNRLDVMSKTFLGLTVACARCHDHKFDAISTADYYALFGVLESTAYRLARFDSCEHNRGIAEQLWRLRADSRPAIQQAFAAQLRPAAGKLGDYLLAARQALEAGPAFRTGQDIVFESWEKGTYEGWEATGTAFGSGPQTQATVAPYQGKINAVGKFFVNSHNVRDKGDVRRGDGHTGTLTSRPFTVTHPFITMMVGGGAHAGKTCVSLLVDDKAVLSATGRNNNQMSPVRWDVRPYLGRTARIQVVDVATGGWGNIGVDHIVFTDGKGYAPGRIDPDHFTDEYRKRLEQIAGEASLDPVLLARWVGHLAQARQDPKDPFHAFALASSSAEAVRPLADAWKRQQGEAASRLEGLEVVIDYGSPPADGWWSDGVVFGPGPVRAGEVWLGSDPARPLAGVHERGAAVSDPVWDVLKPAAEAENDPRSLGSLVRAGRTLLTPAFPIRTGKVFYLVRGKGTVYAAVGQHVMITGPLHGQLVQAFDTGGRYRWVSQDLTRYRGLTTHVEFTPAEGADLAVALVAQGEQAPRWGEPPSTFLLDLVLGEGGRSPAALAAGYQRLVNIVLDRLAADRLAELPPEDSALVVGWLIDHPYLLVANEADFTSRMREAGEGYFAAEAELRAKIRPGSRLAVAMQDRSGIEGHVFIRGSHRALGERVPHRLPEGLSGPGPVASTPGSNRLELARLMTDPVRNPFLARVLVNRVWHHLFGRGVVASVDNFGVLGEKPSHPELLDYLARTFVEDGWSVKRLIRALVLTRAYQMSSARNEEAEGIDPENKLLHRMNLRRLEGESIRDAMLAVSGRLDPRMEGPSVLVHLTPFQDGRGRPASGPLDGDGRRSVYLAVRRNFLSSFLLAFDTPIPFSTVGRRTVSNVPAQALILMNDPFVHQQADLWARGVLGRKESAPERITRMYRTAIARPPSAAEMSACMTFLARQAMLGGAGVEDVAVWKDLAHALFNTKDFIFLK